MISRDMIVGAARAWLGTPYHHQASVKGVGCDCLGLVRGVFREVYNKEPEVAPAYTRDWAEARGMETLLEAAGRHLTQRHLTQGHHTQGGGIEDAQPGDVLVFRLNDHSVAKHAGILVSDLTMVHAQEKVGCVEVSLGRWWRRRVAGAFQFRATYYILRTQWSDYISG